MQTKPRLNKLFEILNNQSKKWDAVFIFDKVNQYYFTGTMQDGVLVLTKKGDHAYFVRKSYDRAVIESDIKPIYRMSKYSDIIDILGNDIHNVYIETNSVTLNMMLRLQKYFKFDNIYPAEPIISKIKAVKSPDELEIIRKSGMLHEKLFNEIIPSVLREGMNEAELTAILFKEMIQLGFHGVSRFSMFQNETVVGQIGFGDNSIYPTYFDGPGGMKGMSSAVPIIGDRNRALKKGDLVFIDIGFGCDGYHTDKTQIYSFVKKPDSKLSEYHNECIRIQNLTASMLKAGNIPSEIYNIVLNTITPEFQNNFMGIGNECVKFLGHGVGLQIDEYPVIANGFNEPLEAGMVIAIEPKKSIPGVGIVGVEDTYIVTDNGGECITGGGCDIIVV